MNVLSLLKLYRLFLFTFFLPALKYKKIVTCDHIFHFVMFISSYLCFCKQVETESEKSIGVQLELDHNVLIGEHFTVKASVTNKASSLRYLP